MEPSKFEKHIKNKLEARRISPSEEAWEKISGKIERPTQHQRKSYFWMGIAASMVLLVGISIFFFSSSKEINEGLPTKVVVEEEPNIIIQKEVFKDSEILDNPGSSAIVVKHTKIDSIGKSKNRIVKPNAIVVKEPIEDTSILIANTTKSPVQENSIAIVPTEVLDAKIAEVIAKVDAIEEDGYVSDAEVDSLLLKAQREILTEKLFNSDNSVNAMALLSEVEEELDQSFRDQIFESLKTGFLKVRTAVADRNN